MPMAKPNNNKQPTMAANMSLTLWLNGLDRATLDAFTSMLGDHRGLGTLTLAELAEAVEGVEALGDNAARELAANVEAELATVHDDAEAMTNLLTEVLGPLPEPHHGAEQREVVAHRLGQLQDLATLAPRDVLAEARARGREVVVRLPEVNNNGVDPVEDGPETRLGAGPVLVGDAAERQRGLDLDKPAPTPARPPKAPAKRPKRAKASHATEAGIAVVRAYLGRNPGQTAVQVREGLAGTLDAFDVKAALAWLSENNHARTEGSRNKMTYTLLAGAA